jgi:hypothetical protein
VRWAGGTAHRPVSGRSALLLRCRDTLLVMSATCVVPYILNRLADWWADRAEAGRRKP